MTPYQAIANISEKLKPVSGEFALPEAERILEFLLGCSRSDLYAPAEKEIAPGIVERTDAIVARRLTDEPLPYIIGSAYFYDREMRVTPAVLIPRPDTEILIEEILKNEKTGSARFLDFGTGSGCIAAVLSAHRPSWKAFALDSSPSALSLAKHNCQGTVSLLCGSGLSTLRTAGTLDFIAANPPYIPTPALASLPRSVRCFEPLSALDGGRDGLAFYRLLAAGAPPLLKAAGGIYCEIGYDQGSSAPEIFAHHGWTDISVIKDNGGNLRVMTARRPNMQGRV